MRDSVDLGKVQWCRDEVSGIFRQGGTEDSIASSLRREMKGAQGDSKILA